MIAALQASPEAVGIVVVVEVSACICPALFIGFISAPCRFDLCLALGASLGLARSRGTRFLGAVA